MNNLVLVAEDLAKTFTQVNAPSLTIFQEVNLLVTKGETVSIVGSSGSGKTTLLHLLAGLDQLSSGKVSVCNYDLSLLSSEAACKLRNQHLGFIYQFHHLLAEFTALENTVMPLLIGNCHSLTKLDYAHYLLNRLGLAKRITHYPHQLSGGERQRVAIARALVAQPQIIFADEPTGNLDNITAHQVFDIFLELQHELQTSLILVTHDNELAAKAQTSYYLHNGYLYQKESLA